MEDTIRTKGLTFARNHLKEIAAYAIAAGSMTVTASMALGHRQADNEMLSTTVRTLSDKVDSLSGKVDGIALSQAEMKGTLTVVKEQVQDVAQFKVDVTEGIKDARKVSVPTLTGRRARKP